MIQLRSEQLPAERHTAALGSDCELSVDLIVNSASVKRFVGKLRGPTTPDARVVIETAPGEELPAGRR
jgi:hypothetical protein